MRNGPIWILRLCLGPSFAKNPPFSLSGRKIIESGNRPKNTGMAHFKRTFYADSKYILSFRQSISLLSKTFIQNTVARAPITCNCLCTQISYSDPPVCQAFHVGYDLLLAGLTTLQLSDEFRTKTTGFSIFYLV